MGILELTILTIVIFAIVFILYGIFVICVELLMKLFDKPQRYILHEVKTVQYVWPNNTYQLLNNEEDWVMVQKLN